MDCGWMIRDVYRWLAVEKVYAPEDGTTEEIKLFYEQLQVDKEKYNKMHHLIVARDFNAMVGIVLRNQIW